EVLAASVPVGTLCDADYRNAAHAELVEDLAGDGKLPGAAVDQHEVGPVRKLLAVRLARRAFLEQGWSAVAAAGFAGFFDSDLRDGVRAQHPERDAVGAPGRDRLRLRRHQARLQLGGGGPRFRPV